MTNHDTSTRDWTELTARDVMQEKVITVSYSAPLSEVERVLADNRIGGVPVTDAAGHVAGVISARDLLDLYTEDPDARPHRRRSYYHYESDDLDDVDFTELTLPEESEETAGSIMTAEAYTVAADASLKSVAAEMSEHRIHRVLVTDPKRGGIVGLVSTMDLIRAFAGN